MVMRIDTGRALDETTITTQVEIARDSAKTIGIDHAIAFRMKVGSVVMVGWVMTTLATTILLWFIKAAAR